MTNLHGIISIPTLGPALFDEQCIRHLKFYDPTQYTYASHATMWTFCAGANAEKYGQNLRFSAGERQSPVNTAPYHRVDGACRLSGP